MATNLADARQNHVFAGAPSPGTETAAIATMDSITSTTVEATTVEDSTAETPEAPTSTTAAMTTTSLEEEAAVVASLPPEAKKQKKKQIVWDESMRLSLLVFDEEVDDWDSADRSYFIRYSTFGKQKGTTVTTRPSQKRRTEWERK